MTSVKHMKWWGWGVDGVGFHYEDKPGFAPFVLQAVGLDLLTAERAGEPAFADLKVPKSNATAAFTKTLAGIVGADNVSTDDMLRVIHTYGKSLRDLVRIRGNMIKRSPDVVVSGRRSRGAAGGGCRRRSQRRHHPVRRGRTYLQAGIFNIHGLALYDLDRKPEARQYFEKALALDSNFLLPRQNLEAPNSSEAEANKVKNGANPPSASPANKQD